MAGEMRRFSDATTLIDAACETAGEMRHFGDATTLTDAACETAGEMKRFGDATTLTDAAGETAGEMKRFGDATSETVSSSYKKDKLSCWHQDSYDTDLEWDRTQHLTLSSAPKKH